MIPARSSQGWRYDETGDIVTSEPNATPQGFRKLLGEELIQNGDFVAAVVDPHLWRLVKYADGRNRRAGRFDGRVIRAIQVPKREANHEQWAVWS